MQAGLWARRHGEVQLCDDASSMIVHLIDGTYELFRHFYGLRRVSKGDDRRSARSSGVLHTVLQMIEGGATHIGVATDHVIESFRNDLWPATRPGEASSRRCGRSSIRSRRRSPPWASPSGRWSSSKPTTRSPPRRASPRRRARREGLHLDARTRTSRSASAATASCRWIGAADRFATRRCPREVRRPAGADPRLSRAGRRRGRRLSGHPRHRRVTAARLVNQHGPIEDFPARCSKAIAASSRCSSRSWRRSGRRPRCWTTSRSCAGRDPRPPGPHGSSGSGDERLAERCRAAQPAA